MNKIVFYVGGMCTARGQIRPAAVYLHALIVHGAVQRCARNFGIAVRATVSAQLQTLPEKKWEKEEGRRRMIRTAEEKKEKKYEQKAERDLLTYRENE